MTKIHDNEFDLKMGENITELSFTWNGEYIVTDGQPWDGVTCTGGKIVAKAGRKGSPQCAAWFKDFVNSEYNNMIHTGGGDNLPDNLNFAFKGTLKVNGASCEVCIGQGHRSSTGENNWHIASKNILADSNAKNGVIGFRMTQDGTHAFEFTSG